MMDFSMYPKGNLTQNIVEEIGASIVARQYPSTQRALTEREVCREFEVSRSIAREALSMLASKGLIAPNMSQGTWVQPEACWNLMDKDILRWLYRSKLSEATMHEFIQVRRAIEPASAAFAAKRANNLSVESLADLSAALTKGRSRRKPLIDIQVAIHAAVLSASGNKAFRQFASFIEVSVRASHKLISPNDESRASAVEHYQALISSIASAQAQSASDVMQKILRRETKALSSLTVF